MPAPHQAPGPVEKFVELGPQCRDLVRIRRVRRFVNEVHIGILDELVERLLEPGGRNAQAIQLAQAGILVGREPLQEVGPRPVLRSERLGLLQFAKAGGQSGLERPFAQELGAECMDRAQKSLVDALDRLFQRLALRVSGCEAGRGSFQLHLESLPQFGGGHAREGDRSDLLHLAGAIAHKRHHAIDQRGRLARARPRLDEEAALQILANAKTRSLVRGIPAETFPRPTVGDRRAGVGGRLRVRSCSRTRDVAVGAQKTGSSASQLRALRSSSSS